MKRILSKLMLNKLSSRSSTAVTDHRYRTDPLSHPDLRQMSEREIGDIYISPDKTLP